MHYFRVNLLRELVPRAKPVAVLVNPTNPTTEPTLRDLETAARGMGLQIQVFNAATSSEVNAVFATFVRERPDALFVAGTPFSQWPACPIDPLGDAPSSPCVIRVA